MNSSQTKQYMYRALELAKKGTGAVNPNPLVGAVLVKDNRIIGEGYHQKYGQLHAERNAIADCYRRGENPAGSRTLRDVRAMLSLRKNTALYGGNY